MTTARYTVVFQGRIVSGLDEGRVKQNLQHLFKLSREQVDKLFSGRDITLRRNLSHDQAMLLQQKLYGCGAECVIRRMPEEVRGEGAGREPERPAPVTAVDAAEPGGHDRTTQTASPSGTPAPKIPAVPVYPLPAPLYLALGSLNFYKGIAHQWDVRRAFIYMFLLVVVTQLPLIGYAQYKTNALITTYADLVPQVPSIRLRDHSMTIEGITPRVLRHAGEDVLIVDPAGTRESLAASGAKALINSSEVLLKGGNGRIRDYSLPGIDIEINRQAVEKWLPVASHWLWLLLILLLIPATYLLFCLKALFYGWIGTLIAKRHLATPSFKKVLVLAIVCLTPVAMLDVVLQPVLGGTPLFIGMVLTVTILNLAVRQHGRGEREMVAAALHTSDGGRVSAAVGGQPKADAPGAAATIEFRHGKKFNHLMYAMIGVAALPLLVLFALLGGDQKFLLVGVISLIAVSTVSLVTMLIVKRMPFATLDATTLSLNQITIPWSQIHAVQEKTVNLGLIKWRTLVLSGTFRAPITGNRLNLPLALLDEPDALIKAITQRITTVEAVSVRQRAALHLDPVQGEEVQYRKMRFTNSGITTHREVIPWAQVTGLAGQANVIAGLGMMTVSYRDLSGKGNSLTVPAECSKAYQGVVAFAIAHAQAAEVDPELVKLLETDAAEARSSYLFLGLVLSGLILLIAAMVVLESYKFAFLLKTFLILAGMTVWGLALKNVFIAGTQGDKVPLPQKKAWSWGAFALPITVVLLAMAVTPDSRHWLLGDASAKMGAFARAENHYHQALLLSNNNYLIRFDLGTFYMNRGEWEKAFEHLDPPIREHIGNWTPEAVLFVPETLMHLGRREEAIKWCEGVLHDPKIPRDVAPVLTNKLAEIRSGLL